MMIRHLYHSLVIFTRLIISNTRHKTLDVRHMNTETSLCERRWRTNKNNILFFNYIM